MAKIHIEEITPNIAIDTNSLGEDVVIEIASYIPISGKAIKDLISTDINNDLKYGSDNKLLSQPTDTDFLAYYILAKG